MLALLQLFSFCILNLHLLSGTSQLVVLNRQCICPGDEVRLECTIVGRGATFWNGTAFSCAASSNSIVLIHHDGYFGGIRWCGAIIVQGIRQDGLNFTSQLIINHISSTLDRRTMNCFHDNSRGSEIAIGSYTIQFTRDPPSNVHLAEVEFARLTFCWNPVAAVCPNIKYEILSEGCGICPNSTSNSCATCAQIDPTINTTCNFSVQSIVCENISGNFSDPVSLKLGGVPSFERILPYYSNTSHKLIKLIFHSLHNVNSLDEFGGSTVSYMFNIYSTSDMVNQSGSVECGSIVIPASSCQDKTCNVEFINDRQLMSCHKNFSSNILLTAFASNVLGDGPSSVPVVVETTNSLLHVVFDIHTNSFLCQFTVGNFGKGPKSCKILYGGQHPITHGCFSLITSKNSTNTNISNTVTVFLPKLDHTDSAFCFTAIGKTAAFTVAVKGTFRTGAAGNQVINNEFQVISLSFVALLTVLLTILIIAIILLARGRARALKELGLLRESGRRQNVTYEEINLTPSAIDTRENVA